MCQDKKLKETRVRTGGGHPGTHIKNTPQFSCQSPPGSQILLCLSMRDLILSLPPSFWLPISQKQVRKMGDLRQALELLGTVLRLESRLSDFKLCALHLTATADSDFGWQVGWVEQGISSWSRGEVKVLG